MKQTEQNTDLTPLQEEEFVTAMTPIPEFETNPVSLDIPSVSSSTLQNVAEHPRTPEDVLPVWINGEDLNELNAD